MGRLKGLLAILLVAGLAVGIGAQEADWFENKPIEAFKFEGLDRIKEKDLTPIVSPFIGKPLNLAILNDVQRRLLDLEYFDLVTPDALEGSKGKESVILVFTVSERPAVSQIIFKGNSSLRNGDLLEVVKIKPGDTMSRSKAKTGSDAILELYLGKGYPKATVSFEIIENTSRKNARDIVYTIAEGLQTSVKSVKFSGNTFASEGTLKGLLKSQEQGLFNAGFFQEANLELDKERILTYYRDNGFIDARVVDVVRNAETIEDGKKEVLSLSFVLEEGLQFTFSGISIEGNQVFTSEELLALVRSRSGTILSQSKLDADVRAIQDKYYQQGYAFNQWSIIPSRSDENRTISYLVKVSEGPVAYIGDIQVRGNAKTKRFIIDRELPFKVGDVFSTAKLREGYYALMNTRYFSSVIPEPTVMANGLIQINITVVEQNTMDVRVGGSLSGDENFPLAFIGKFNDLNFLGQGWTFGTDLTASGKEVSLKSSFFDAWLFGEELGGGLNLELAYSKLETLNLLDNTESPGSPGSIIGGDFMPYDNVSLGTGGSLGKVWRTPVGRLRLNGGLNTRVNYLWYDDDLGVPRSEELVANQERMVFINSMNLGISLDGRDLSFDPTRGYLASQTATLYGGFLFGERHYISTETTFQWWHTLWDIPIGDTSSIKTVFGINSSLRVLWPQFWTPNGDQYMVGGDSLIINPMVLARGWYNWASETGMAAGGEALWNNWAEIRTPLVPGVVSFDIFFDAVRLQTQKEDIFVANSTGWLFGYGAGLRLTMQGLPLRLYLGKRFSLEDSGGVKWQRGSLFASSPTSTDGIDLILAISLF